MNFRTTGRAKDKGATLVEAAIAYSLLFVVLFGVVEFGLAFKDWLSVSNATREGARAGATFGDNPSTDILVLDGVEATLLPHGWSPGDKVTIFKANDPNGQPKTTYTYNPSFDCSDPDNIFAPGECCDWSPCPEDHRDLYTVPAWDPATRDITAPGTDRIGVSIEFTHEWITGLIGTSPINFTVTTDFQLEPQLFSIGA